VIDFDAEVLSACDEEFGIVALYLAGSEQAYDAAGIFTKGYKSPVLGGDGLPAWTTSAPTFVVRAINLRAPPARNDRIAIDGAEYMVMDVRADGVGSIVLPLKVTG